ncbi:MAG: chemotaxis response regulator protein-glutamate methylesterase [Proteobacteria bacterium]|nr:chemotaxis response regulator protein-glutamate methylesterase [Pseudomonadota bacterium]
MNSKIRVLVIDDSPFVRARLSVGLNKDPHIEVVGTASDPYSARDKIVLLKPDVLTLDVSMPRMDGVEFLKKLMPQYPVPTIMVSAFTEKGAGVTLEALEAGAVDFVAKPRSGNNGRLDDMFIELRAKIIIASTVNVKHFKHRVNNNIPYPESIVGPLISTRNIIAMGASTGGTEAIKEVLMHLPPQSPGVVVVQHMPEKFTETFARRLNDQCHLTVAEARSGDRIEPNNVLIAPGNRHMEVFLVGRDYKIRLKSGDKVSGHRPSVDVLMRSVARCAGHHGRGILLTGMGADGAEGMREMKQAGAKTFAQNKASCVVFGMPKKAWEIGGVDHMLPLDRIAGEVIRSLLSAT